MPPTADQIENAQRLLQAYKTQLRMIVAKHKVKVKKTIEEIDRRRALKRSNSLKHANPLAGDAANTFHPESLRGEKS